jgi:prophage tail gpP-like protein
MVLDRIGTQSMASGFAMPGNIEDIDAERSIDGRFSDYTVVYSPIASLTQLSPLANFRAHTADAYVKSIEYRPKIIVCPQTTLAVDADFTAMQDVGVTMAKWELARRIGRSQAANIIADKWRDSAGKLWTPNWLATIEAPGADITGAKWIIGTVTYRKDMSGTHADLILMPPAAFEPDPTPLTWPDAQLYSIPPTTQNPAPPTTTAPLGDTPASTAPQNNSTAPGIN